MPTNVPRVTILIGESLMRVIDRRASKYMRSRIGEIAYLCDVAAEALGDAPLPDDLDETWVNDTPNSGRCNVYEEVAKKASARVTDPETSISEAVRRMVRHGLLIVRKSENRL